MSCWYRYLPGHVSAGDRSWPSQPTVPSMSCKNAGKRPHTRSAHTIFYLLIYLISFNNFICAQSAEKSMPRDSSKIGHADVTRQAAECILCNASVLLAGMVWVQASVYIVKYTIGRLGVPVVCVGVRVGVGVGGLGGYEVSA